MIRAQRRFHAIVWPLLAVAFCVLIGAALTARVHVDRIVDAAPHARPAP